MSDMEKWRDEVTGVLREHHLVRRYPDALDTCTCGEWESWDTAPTFDEHQAQALLPLLDRIDREVRAEERERAKVNDDVRREQIRMARAEGEIARQVRHITAEVDAYARARMLGGPQVEHYCALLAERADDHAEICDDQEAKP